MSMTVHICLGITELDLLMEALNQMGKTAYVATDSELKIRGKSVKAVTEIEGQKIGFIRNRKGELVMIGDAEWRGMKGRRLHERIIQQYGVAAIKRKARELRYQVASTETLEDGSIKVVARAWG